MALTKEQMAVRRLRVGSSEIGALLGVDEHRTAIDIFAEKTLPRETPAEVVSEETDHRDWGLHMEPAILAAHARRMRYVIQPPTGTLVHPAHDVLCATPDALALTPAGSLRDLQAKNAQWHQAGAWGDPATDAAPLAYVAQVTVELGILRATMPNVESTGDLVVSIGGAPPVVYPVAFDADLFAGLLEVAERFVRDHLRTGKPPPLDGSNAASEYVKRRWVTHTAEMLPATAEAAALVAEAKMWADTRKEAEGQEERAKNLLKAMIGESAGVDGLVTWKRTKDTLGTVLDVPGLMGALTALLGPAETQRLVAAATHEQITRQGYRRLNFLKAKESK